MSSTVASVRTSPPTNLCPSLRSHLQSYFSSSGLSSDYVEALEMGFCNTDQVIDVILKWGTSHALPDNLTDATWMMRFIDKATSILASPNLNQLHLSNQILKIQGNHFKEDKALAKSFTNQMFQHFGWCATSCALVAYCSANLPALKTGLTLIASYTDQVRILMLLIVAYYLLALQKLKIILLQGTKC